MTLVYRRYRVTACFDSLDALLSHTADEHHPALLDTIAPVIDLITNEDAGLHHYARSVCGDDEALFESIHDIAHYAADHDGLLPEDWATALAIEIT